MIKSQQIRHSPLLMQYLAQLFDDHSGVLLLQLGNDQGRMGIVSQRAAGLSPGDLPKQHASSPFSAALDGPVSWRAAAIAAVPARPPETPGTLRNWRSDAHYPGAAAKPTSLPPLACGT